MTQVKLKDASGRTHVICECFVQAFPQIFCLGKDRSDFRIKFFHGLNIPFDSFDFFVLLLVEFGSFFRKDQNG